ncbi:hypothetical protein ASPACDRAFT_57003 [Aspergillus aculeatus ATCC 16872]|uniref:Uncharacterized protein n=1 Tax=Aspergillus aculeatus (strain ATCC 16872 / CBS 172.66 / WB 5094) TaxID=690307 RepID=A0A1L9X5L4_ASPA1|nr:uncharacterized protein ASPACDRAFT_57003 [Aspergillus aculeatus ATCC 16872]OJK03614.1 hypothetical protein ASPACDRAFT_57003 [Aspergillus aculeatus ATCC 16872]
MPTYNKEEQELVDSAVYVWGPYDGWFKQGVEPVSYQHALVRTADQGQPFRYTGQPVDLRLIYQIATFLEQHDVPCYLINDGMWRVYGCKNRILSVDLVIGAWTTKKAVQALREAGFDDKPQSTNHFKSQKDSKGNHTSMTCGCGIRKKGGDCPPMSSISSRPPGKSAMVGRPPLNDDTSLVTIDPRLAEYYSDLKFYEIKVLRPAGLVEALVRLCYRDLGATWVQDLTNIFYSAAAADHTDGPSDGEDHNLPWGFQNSFANPFFAEAPALTLQGLDPAWLSSDRSSRTYPAMNEFAWRFKEADFFPDGTGPFPEVHYESWNKLRRDFPGVSAESKIDSADTRCNFLEAWISVKYNTEYRWRGDPWSRYYRSP